MLSAIFSWGVTQRYESPFVVNVKGEREKEGKYGVKVSEAWIYGERMC